MEISTPAIRMIGHRMDRPKHTDCSMASCLRSVAAEDRSPGWTGGMANSRRTGKEGGGRSRRGTVESLALDHRQFVANLIVMDLVHERTDQQKSSPAD